MEINHLREYIAFSTTMSFARTAKELFLSAPTLRSHIKLIESELGVPLLAKRDDRIEFTPRAPSSSPMRTRSSTRPTPRSTNAARSPAIPHRCSYARTTIPRSRTSSP
ncbi:LysR family transcriptional regulator [Eggerthella sinensis]|uniref:HTH lysR-type domain-containing protein n=1 Tax=Eggerthella sinensis TaxID=242230 RepID=A0A3N0IUW2_9ACTN|nr:hypothetical protein C1876_17035 [Eggerthella sinensis]RNM40132.1 hypothetical protein DMP09_15690 [Eggerthella sinensis]